MGADRQRRRASGDRPIRPDRRILGPNSAGPDDHTFVLRRATLLRDLLRGKTPRFFEGDRLIIDSGALRAFLDVPTYVHGARSMEAIVDMSALTGSVRYAHPALPARHQLSLHVDADAFLDLVRRTTEGWRAVPALDLGPNHLTIPGDRPSYAGAGDPVIAS
jgi:hypothetical protein